MKKFIATVWIFMLLCISASAQDVTLSGSATCGAAAVSGTWVVPCNVTSITIQVNGAGGGAGGGGGGSNGGLFNTRGGGGGGGGGYTTTTINVVPGSSFSYSMGSGGCGGSGGSDGSGGGNGTAGGNATFTGTALGGTPVSLTANGGARGTGGSGTGGSTGSGGAGGTASGGTTNTTGASGNSGSGGSGGAGGAGAGPTGGAGGASTGANGNTYGGGGAGGGDSPGGRGAAGGILITYNTTIAPPVTPTISSTPPGCSVDGTSTISNYDPGTTYTFSPAGPSAGAGGLISGMVTGTSYTVVAGTGPCASAPSAAFSNPAATGIPAVPTISTTPPTCTADGSSTISNYNAGTTYTFTPGGPSAGAGGLISGMITGTSYTVVAGTGPCASAPSASFSNGAQLPVPVASISGTLSYCTGSNTTLTASGGTGYAWTNAGGANIGNTATVTVTQGTYTVVVTNASACTATASATVTEIASLPVTISGALNYCAGGNTTLTASGGSSYVWTNGSTTASITVTQGTYSVTATDANGCTGTASSTVTESPLPVINISGALSYCAGANTTLTASGASSYVWNDAGNSTTASITVTQGNYTVSGTDANACTATASATVTENALPLVSISGSLTYCTGGNTTLTASGGMGYLWSNGATTASVTVTQGTYTVSATDANGCTATASATVTESTSLSVSITGTLSYCTGGNTTLTANGGTGYLWNDAGNSTTAGITVTAGTYSVTASDVNGCTGTATATVTELSAPAINISGALSYCAGESTTLTASGGTSYVWNDAGGSTTASITATQGSYVVTGTDANTCTATASATVTENALPTVNVSGSLTYCTGGSTTLTANGGIAYSWSNGEITASVTVTQGTYTVSATDANGCTATASATVTESSSLSVNITGTMSHCPGGNTTLTASGGTSYTWSNGSATPSITATQGTYSVTATDASCSGTASAVVSEIATTPLNLGSNVSVCDTTLVMIDAGSGYTSYTWGNGETTQTILPQTSGAYSVTVVDANGCGISGSLNVVFNECTEVEDYTVFIPNAFTPNNDGNNDLFQWFITEVVFAEIKVFNRWGEKVFETNNVNEYWDGNYRGTRCGAGVFVYDIKLVGHNGRADKYKGSVTLFR